MAIEIRMPLLSDTMKEGIIVSWNKKVGDFVQADDVIADIETDKATMELVGYQEGTVLYLNGKKGDSIAVNDVIVILGHRGEDISKLLEKLNLPQYETIRDIRNERKPIFISYSRVDVEFALKVGQDLRKSGENIWMDKLDIRAGEAWDKAIQAALKNSEYILTILSGSSVESNNVLNEIYYGIDNGKKIIPLLISECEIPFNLYRIHYIDFRQDYKSSFEHLLYALEKR